MNTAVTATYVIHGLVCVVLLGLAVGNYQTTGDPLSAATPILMAFLVAGLGVTVGRVVARRD